MASSERSPFSSPAERARNTILIGTAVNLIALTAVRSLISRSSSPRLAMAAFMVVFFVVVAGFGFRFLKGQLATDARRQQNDSVWDWWLPTTDSSPLGQRRAYAIKAARFYAVAFDHDTILVSPRIDSKRKVKRWVGEYVAGEEVEIEHRIPIDDIDEVVLTAGVSATIRRDNRTYQFDGWFNRFDGQHHEALKALVDRAGLSPIENAPSSARFVRVDDDTYGSEGQPASASIGLLRRGSTSAGPLVSLGGGSNMFDWAAAHG